MLMAIKGLAVHYGAITALDDVEIAVNSGEILSIIGANGAGKTTLLKTIMGMLRAAAGEIEFEGMRLKGLKTDTIVKLGLTMVPEGRRVFPHLSVRENLDLGGYALTDKVVKKELFELIMTTFPRLEERLKQLAGTLSGGEQQMLAMGRALMSNPKLLLLDEPSMGLSPIVTREIFSLISIINQEKGISMLLVEQNANMALEHSHRTYVLDNGRITMHGMSWEMKNDSGVIRAYLGV
jgi:branched-chain amino acid transport system ATP-binding protein